MDIGVIIPSHGLADKLGRCLNNVTESNQRHDLTICVVDNGTTDRSVLTTCRSSGVWQNQYYMRLPHNFHFARACNTGIHVMGIQDAFLFLNNDCYVDPPCIDAMANALIHGKGSIIGALLRYPNDTIQHAGGEIIGNWQVVNHRFRGVPIEDPNAAKSCQVSFVTAACMLVHARTFVENGGFQEVYYNGYEDVDLCMTFISLGKKIYYCAEATAIHEEAQTPGRKEKESENAALFFGKWRTNPVDEYKF